MDPVLLQENVQRQLWYDPRVDNSHICVSANGDGVVTLSGTVPSYSDKVAASAAARRAKGVRGIADEVEVAMPPAAMRDDAEVARSVLGALARSGIPRGSITVTVSHGWVVLTGEVDDEDQRRTAEEQAGTRPGVTGLTNEVRVRADTGDAPGDVIRRIERALVRHEKLGGRKIEVKNEEYQITLEGTVRSLEEAFEAEDVALAVRGVREVVNRLRIAP